METQQLQQLRIDCVRRVAARRRPLVERVQHGRTPDQDITWREAPRGLSEFLEPVSLTEWIDDQAAVRYQFRGPFTLVLAAALEAARVSEGAAVAALKAARQLDSWQQWALYGELEQMRHEANELPAALSLTKALRAAWEKTRGLPTERPDFPAVDKPDPRPAEKIDYPTKWGIPAGVLL